jgi:hypothetical protein
VAAEAWGYYKTQNDFTDAQLKEYSEMPVSLIFGKSLVGGTTTGDVFEGITANPIAYVRAKGYELPQPNLSLELGGPWAFYRAFWKAHDIDQIGTLYSPEAQVGPKDTLWLPLIVHNDTDSAKKVTLHSRLPQDWKQQPDASIYAVGAHDSYSIQLKISPAASAEKGSWQNLTWDAEGDGKKIGTATLRVKVESNGLPQ